MQIKYPYAKDTITYYVVADKYICYSVWHVLLTILKVKITKQTIDAFTNEDAHYYTNSKRLHDV